MTMLICRTCGTHHLDPSPVCDICADERQWVPPDGQEWASADSLTAEGFGTEIRELEPRLYGIGLNKPLGVGHRGLLVCTAQGNILWDPPAYVDQAAYDAVTAVGGLHFVSSSHPHMYGTSADWAQEFDATVLFPAADGRWLRRPMPGLRTWEGSISPLPEVTLWQTGGHFPGSAVLHWRAGAAGRGALFVGDTIFVTPGEDRVSFMWSAPNRLPLPTRHVETIIKTVAPLVFARVYGGWWTPVIREDGARIVNRSAARYLQFMRDEVDIDT